MDDEGGAALDSLFSTPQSAYEECSFTFIVKERMVGDFCDDVDSSSEVFASTFTCGILDMPNLSSTDFDKTGEVVWPVSVLLTSCLLNLKCVRRLLNEGRSGERSRIIELGAGVGLPSLALFEYSRNSNLSIVATDGREEFVEGGILGRNVSRLMEKGGVSSAGMLTSNFLLWGKVDHIHDILSNGGPYDLVYAADVLQWPAVLEPLAETVHALLYGARNPRFIVGVVERDDGTLRRTFFETLQSFGFGEARAIDYKEFLQTDGEGGFLLPERGAEFGGRSCTIWECCLLDKERVPNLLLTGAEDRIKGRGFEQTLTMPC